jgi:hypothetical protein
MDTTNELLKIAGDNIIFAQNEDWNSNIAGDDTGARSLAPMLFQDSQARSLLAIAQEFKRFNDLLETLQIKDELDELNS